MYLKYPILAFMAAQIMGAVAKDPEPETAAVPPTLNAQVTTTFPDADTELLGLRLVNGKPTRAAVEVSNHETGPIRVTFVSGALTSAAGGSGSGSGSVVHNMTAARYDLMVGAGESKVVPYTFALDMMPQHVGVQLVAVVADDKGGVFRVSAYNGTASIVEAPTSFLDPQIIFLYLFLSAASAATLYFVYKTWIETLFPQTKRAPRTPKKTKRAVPDADAAATLSGSESTAATTTATGSKTYDESWIPDHHMARPAAGRRSKPSTPKAR